MRLYKIFFIIIVFINISLTIYICSYITNNSNNNSNLTDNNDDFVPIVKKQIHDDIFIIEQYKGLDDIKCIIIDDNDNQINTIDLDIDKNLIYITYKEDNDLIYILDNNGTIYIYYLNDFYAYNNVKPIKIININEIDIEI